MELGDPDGYGRYGIVDRSEDGLLCHECGRDFVHLGLHAWREHGMTAAVYRESHGLAHRGLVVDEVRERQRSNAAARMNSPAGQAFVAARDPARATAARLARKVVASPEGSAANRAALRAERRARPRGRIVTCPQCGAEFCPFGPSGNASRRQFCSRSCASRYHRRGAGMRS